jgi:hypothetical protein
MMMRGIALFATAMVCSAPELAAQEPVAVGAADDLCFRARPRSECRAFFVTNAGPYVQLDALDVDRIRFTVDLGAMVNVSSKNAVGGSWFVFGQSGENVSMGPSLRWRRWLGPTESVARRAARARSRRRRGHHGRGIADPAHYGPRFQLRARG